MATQKQIHRCRGEIDGCQTGRGLRDWVKIVKELNSTNCQLQKGHGDLNIT